MSPQGTHGPHRPMDTIGPMGRLGPFVVKHSDASP